MFAINEKIRFTISELPGYGGQVTGEITLRDLTPEAFESWTREREALAEVTLPSPTAA